MLEDGTELKFYSTPGPKTFHEAQTFCQKEGSDLMSVNRRTVINVSNARFLRDMNTDHWVGGYRPSMGIWGWQDGSPLNQVNFSFWERGYPSMNLSEDAAILQRKIGLVTTWTDSSTDVEAKFICEKSRSLTNFFKPSGKPKIRVKL